MARWDSGENRVQEPGDPGSKAVMDGLSDLGQVTSIVFSKM